jgi:hypothetical protein
MLIFLGVLILTEMDFTKKALFGYLFFAIVFYKVGMIYARGERR